MTVKGYEHLDLPVPPVYTSNTALFAWTVELHNSVRRVQGKTEMCVAEALAIYAVPAA